MLLEESLGEEVPLRGESAAKFGVEAALGGPCMFDIDEEALMPVLLLQFWWGLP